MYEPDVVYEVTARTIQGRMLLRPSPAFNRLVAGVIGRAQALYPSVMLYGVFVLSNHITWLVSSARPADISAFFAHVQGNLSRVVGREHDWSGPLWERRVRAIPIVDVASLIDRFRYLLAQGTKEGLVLSPLLWPGVSCVRALLGLEPLRGLWHDFEAFTRALRRGKDVSLRDFAIEYTVRFAKLPCWADLSDEAYAARVAELVAEIEKAAAAERQGRPVLGAEAVLATDPHTRPEDLARSPAPLCHASTKSAQRQYRDRYRRFVASFRAAAECLRRGLEAVFPPYSFPPPRPFVVSTA